MKRLITILAVLATLAFASTAVASQINAHAYWSDTGAPAAGVNVAFDGQSLGSHYLAVASDSGKFQITLPHDTYDMYAFDPNCGTPGCFPVFLSTSPDTLLVDHSTYTFNITVCRPLTSCGLFYRLFLDNA